LTIDRTDPESFALSEVIARGDNAGLQKYLQELPLFKECCPENPYLLIQSSTCNDMHWKKV
tara:strand:+ start:740 stop:922 length:183 start_codon:yes stop_codon:yes gene_type:complete